MIDCPHCFLRVIPMAGGICPSCRGDTAAKRTDGRELLEIAEKAQLPPVCCLCGEPCQRRVRLRSVRKVGGTNQLKRGDSDGAIPLSWRLLFGPFSMAVAFWNSTRGAIGAGEVAVELHIPQCASCSKKSPLEPIRVDYDFFRMDIAVTKVFIQEFRKLNGNSGGKR